MSTTDRPTATYPTHPLAAAPATAYTSQDVPDGRQVDPSGYLPATPATAARLAQADATPTEALPTRRPRPEGVGARQPRPAQPRPGQLVADAASLSHGGARPRPGGRAVYHTASQAPFEQPRHEGGRHPHLRPHLRAALTGVLLAVALLTGLQLYALDGISDARSQARAAHSTSQSRAAVPQPGQDPASPSAMSGQAPAAQSDARTGTQPALSGRWVTHDSGAPYDRTDPSASPLQLPRCTTAQDTPLPCLASTFPQNSNEIPTRVVVLEEDASLTGLDRQ